MVDIDQSFSYRKSNKGFNLINHLFKRRSKRNLNEMVKCLSSNSNDRLDQLLTKSTTNVNELNNLSTDEQTDDENQNYDLNNLKETTIRETRFDKHQLNQMERSNETTNQNETKRRLSTPNIVPIENADKERKESLSCKKLSLKMRRSFSPKSKLIINSNSNQKKRSLDQELLEHYNRLSTECNTSYLSLVSNSPISPRVRSIDDDIEMITYDRMDNPFIREKLEKLSYYTGLDCDILSISNLSLNNNPFVMNNYSTNTLSNLNQSTNSSHSNQSTNSNQFNKASSISSDELDEILNFDGKSNKDDNLHQHLIR